MGMAQSSRRPSTRGLTRSLKVNLQTPWDLKTAYGQLDRAQQLPPSIGEQLVPTLGAKAITRDHQREH